jgi:hypothetical protein
MASVRSVGRRRASAIRMRRSSTWLSSSARKYRAVTANSTLRSPRSDMIRRMSRNASRRDKCRSIPAVNNISFELKW